MNLERFIYIDPTGIASLYAQLRGEDVVETICSMEHSRAHGLRLALATFIGGSGESSKSKRETRTTKTTLRPENMLREIVASLRAHGTLCSSLFDAAKVSVKSRLPVWFETRHPFTVPLPLDVFNKTKQVVFLSGFPPYDNPSVNNPQISMPANLCNFPSVRDGHLSPSGHDGLFFTKLNSKPYSYAVFGQIFTNGEEFQVKPYAVRL